MKVMNIMVFNVPAETVGALSILQDFYREVKQTQDKNIHWIFVLSKPYLEETNNIKVLRFPWIKKTWFHRLFFDHFVAPRLIKKFNINQVISFQNLTIPHTKTEQILYVHNALPFIDYKFGFKENKRLWIYQNIIGRRIIYSIRRAKKVIVQTNWMKEAIIRTANVNKQKIEVIPPKMNSNIQKFFEPTGQALTTFFYPASGFTYKNHRVIVEACKKLKVNNITDYRVLFTLKGDENKYISGLYKEIKDLQLPIEFIGNINREEVFDLYTKSILVFPSLVESFGLPLLEAKIHKGIIIASDTPFSHEVLDGYKNAYFFNNSIELAKLVEIFINKRK